MRTYRDHRFCDVISPCVYCAYVGLHVLLSSHRPPDKTVPSVSYQAVWIESAQVLLCRSASGGRTAPPDALRHRPDTKRTCLAIEPTQFTLPHQTRQNSRVYVVSGVAAWIGQLLLTCSKFKIFCRRQSWVVWNPIHTAEAYAIQTRQFCRVWHGGVN